MINKAKKFFFLLSFLIFVFVTVRYYFSEKNIIITNKLRSLYAISENRDIKSLPLLKNDTNDIIVYTNDLEEFKRKSKKRIWEKLISNNDE